MKNFLCLLLLFLSFFGKGQNPGDTTVVQAFTFGSVQDAEIQFPSDEKQYEKILMLYTLKCVPGGAGGLEYPCGEWDYLTYTYLYEPTGVMDSTRFEQASFMVNKDTTAIFGYQEEALYDLIQREDVLYSASNFDNEHLITFGLANTTSSINIAPDEAFRQQFVLNSMELTNALGALRTLKGIALPITSNTMLLDRLEITLSHTTDDSGNQPLHLEDQKICYNKGLSLEEGINRIFFDDFFEWDGSSSIVVDIKYLNKSVDPVNLEFEVDDNYKSYLASEEDRYLNFEGGDIVDIKDAETIFANINDEITISFWCNGDPSVQPVNNSIIEGVDKNGNRVLNIHLPWGNSEVYWDAGIDASNNYDRINRAASPTRFEAAWNHYAFTKNTSTGEMKIYVNGQLWHSGQDKNRSMANVTHFRLGSMANNSNYYRGFMDEFRIWNKELSEQDIQSWMNKSVDSNHPNYSNLLVYFDFNKDEFILQNEVNGLPIGERFGLPSILSKQSGALAIGYESSARPVVHLLTDDYDLNVLQVINYYDTVYREPVALELFEDVIYPEQRSGLKYVWPAEETYIYDQNGNLLGVNQQLTNVETLNLNVRPYYSDPFEVIERFEIGRYITPYGIGLDLGEGWTWVFDVTDYMTLLRGKKRMTAGNWQELLDLKFLFIEGTPSRDVIGIRNLHNGRVNYRNSADANQDLEVDTISFLSETKQAKIKIRNSGHGFGGTLNCSEFCPRTNQIIINGTPSFTQYLWRDDCGSNPLSPQGGTWSYNRANWCPGDKVNADEYELANLVNFNNEATIDYYLQDGYTWSGAGSTPYYMIQSQLVEYGDFNHSLDLSVEEIIAPNLEKTYLRSNPICGQPIINFKNRGAENVNQFKVNYGLVGSISKTAEFNDLDLAFDEEITLDLPFLTNGTWPDNDNQMFYAEIIEVNGTQDYALNNRAECQYEDAAKLNSNYVGFIVEVRTNNNGDETSYTVLDGSGMEILNREDLTSNTTYRDTIYTEQGCYNFTINDSGEDGLEWWANAAQGSGYANIKGLVQQGFGISFRGVNPDFGKSSSISFSAGDPITSTDDEWIKQDWSFTIYPNPSQDYFELRFDQINLNPVNIEIHNHAGQSVFKDQKAFDTVLEYNDINLGKGLYFITVRQGDHQEVKKLVIL